MTTAAGPGCPVDESFDPLSPEFLADPFAVMARAEAPVFFAPSIGYYVVTRYEDIEEVFKDPATYSAAAAQAPECRAIRRTRGWRPSSGPVWNAANRPRCTRTDGNGATSCR